MSDNVAENGDRDIQAFVATDDRGKCIGYIYEAIQPLQPTLCYCEMMEVKEVGGGRFVESALKAKMKEYAKGKNLVGFLYGFGPGAPRKELF